MASGATSTGREITAGAAGASESPCMNKGSSVVIGAGATAATRTTGTTGTTGTAIAAGFTGAIGFTGATGAAASSTILNTSSAGGVATADAVDADARTGFISSWGSDRPRANKSSRSN